MGHVGLIMLFCKANFLQGLKGSIAAVGQMALTNYFMHSLICIVLFTGSGFRLFGKLQRFKLLYVVFGIWIFQLIVSPLWLKYFEYGPMEWLLETSAIKNDIGSEKRQSHLNPLRSLISPKIPNHLKLNRIKSPGIASARRAFWSPFSEAILKNASFVFFCDLSLSTL